MRALDNIELPDNNLALFSSCSVALGVLFVAVHCLGAVAWLLLGSCMLLKLKFHVCVCAVAPVGLMLSVCKYASSLGDILA